MNRVSRFLIYRHSLDSNFGTVRIDVIIFPVILFYQRRTPMQRDAHPSLNPSEVNWLEHMPGSFTTSSVIGYFKQKLVSLGRFEDRSSHDEL